MAKGEKLLIPTPKQTVQSLKIISFDPSGTFRLEGSRWVKVYEILEKKETGNIKEVLKNLNGRLRITRKVKKGTKPVTYLTLMEEKETYSDVQKEIETDQTALESLFLLKPLSVDEAMYVVGDGRKAFSYASMVRGKKDWKEELFLKVKESSDSFMVEDYYGKALSVLEYLSINPSFSFRSLEEIGCPINIVIDLSPVNMAEGFMQTLEKRYNRRLKEESDVINISVLLTYICESDDARTIIERTLKSMLLKSGFALTTAFWAQTTAYESAVSLGICDYSNMRNSTLDVAEQLLKDGGGLCQ